MATSFDLVIRNGLIIDGSGGEPFQADVAVKDGRFAAVGDVAHDRVPVAILRRQGHQNVENRDAHFGPGHI